MLVILRALLTGMAMSALMGLGYFVLPAPLGGLAAATGVVGVVVSSAVAFLASIAGARTESRERDAGYTTAYGRKFDYWQLDPDTGDVLREPGKRQVRRRPRTSWQ